VLAVLPDGRTTYGTGWVIRSADKENRAGATVVATARHVIAGAIKVMVVESGNAIGDQKPATVINSQFDQDIAFLEVKDLDKPALLLTRARPDVGDDVAAAGYTSASDRGEEQGRAKSATLKRGGLSKYFRGLIDRNAQAPVDQVEFDAPILAGFSGGPLLNRCGRVVGMAVTDGGHIQIAEGASVAVAQGVATAVATDEIIRAARAASIDVTPVDTACGESIGLQPPPPPPPAPCPAPFTSSDTAGKPCTPIMATGWQKLVHNLKGPIGILIGIAVLALIVLIGMIFWLMGRRRKPTPSKIFGPSEGIVGPGGPGSNLLDQGYKSKPLGSEVRATSLRLTGRGPDGEPIDLRFTSDQLQASAAMLGVDGDSNARILDNRPKTFVGRKHALLAFDGHHFTVEDNKSTNGTKVGGQKLEPFTKRVLVSGDTLTIADISLRVTVE
jgi:hypothetical protein